MEPFRLQTPHLTNKLFHNPNILIGQSIQLVNQAVDFDFKGGGVGGGDLYLRVRIEEKYRYHALAGG